jgi:hypothetical protein
MKRTLPDLVDAVLWKLGVRTAGSSQRRRSIFTDVYRHKEWGDGESVSGPGSTLARTDAFRAELVARLRELRVSSIVDVPCGDFRWMQAVVDECGVSYLGMDIVGELIAENQQRYARPDRTFLCGDLVSDPLPRGDLLLCRDGLVHLSFADIRAGLENFQQSGARYLLATTFIERRTNADVRTGGWRVLNLEAPPFSFPKPLALIDERCDHSGGIYRDKRLGLWELASLSGSAVYTRVRVRELL